MLPFEEDIESRGRLGQYHWGVVPRPDRNEHEHRAGREIMSGKKFLSGQGSLGLRDVELGVLDVDSYALLP
jgi:hypothetical protein